MSQKKRSLLMIGACLLLAIYVILTEIPERWDSAIGVVSVMINRETQLSKPDDLKLRKIELESEKRIIESRFRAYQPNGRTSTDFYAFLNSCSRESAIGLESITPWADNDAQGSGFELRIKTSYHKLGTFISMLETGPYPLQIREVSMRSESARRATLEVMLRGTVHIES